MIIIHDSFVCKPGNASKVAKMFKEAMKDNKDILHIMTDITGQFHRVVMVSQAPDLATYESRWKEMEKDTEAMKKMGEMMKGMNDMYISGSREIYRVW